MSYLKSPELEELRLPSDPEFFVQMKKKASYGDYLAAQSSLIEISTSEPNGNAQMLPNGDPDPEVVTEAELGAYLRTLVARMVVSWNLTDEAGQILPINEKTIELLQPKDGDFLATEAQKRLGLRSQKKKSPFENTSDQSSGGSPTPTQSP